MPDPNFDGTIDTVAAWPDVPQLSTDCDAFGGPGGPMNAQAVALVARTKKLQADKADATSLGAIDAKADSALAAAASAQLAATAAQDAANAAEADAGDAQAAAANALGVANNAQTTANAASAAVAGKLDKAGGTMTGALVLTGNAANPLEAVPKQQLDAKTTVTSTVNAQAGTNNTELMTPLRTREAFNASGSAPVFACRAWVNFNGTGTVATRASGNVSSVTDNGTGDYTVNFSTALPDANYAFTGCARESSSAASDDATIQAPYTSNPTASALRLRTVNETFNAADCAWINISFFR